MLTRISRLTPPRAKPTEEDTGAFDSWKADEEVKYESRIGVLKEWDLQADGRFEELHSVRILAWSNSEMAFKGVRRRSCEDWHDWCESRSV